MARFHNDDRLQKEVRDKVLVPGRYVYIDKGALRHPSGEAWLCSHGRIACPPRGLDLNDVIIGRAPPSAGAAR